MPTSVFAAFRYAPFNVQIKGKLSSLLLSSLLFSFSLLFSSLFFCVNILSLGATATITLTNLLFGEVWLCSGQSNMVLVSSLPSSPPLPLPFSFFLSLPFPFPCLILSSVFSFFCFPFVNYHLAISTWIHFRCKSLRNRDKEQFTPAL